MPVPTTAADSPRLLVGKFHSPCRCRGGAVLPIRNCLRERIHGWQCAVLACREPPARMLPSWRPFRWIRPTVRRLESPLPPSRGQNVLGWCAYSTARQSAPPPVATPAAEESGGPRIFHTRSAHRARRVGLQNSAAGL